MEEVRGRARTYHAIVSGSFGLGNLGDESLLETFLERHRVDYRSALVLSTGSSDGLARRDMTLPLPRFAIGWRFWWGISDRIQRRRLILARTKDGLREYVWLGGLLGQIPAHNLMRFKELIWASSVCSRFLYYFGDVGDGFAEMAVARKLVRLLDRVDARIAVRSEEAARILEEAGLRTKVHVGLDPVLYDRVVRWGVPFRRRAAASDAFAIIPCNHRPDFHQAAWLGAARAAIRLGMRLRWISFCDREDLPLCLGLAEQIQAEHPNYPQEVCGGDSAEQALSGSVCCLATRFHGAIFALSQGVPVLAVPYDHKLQRLFRLLRLQDWLIKPKQLETSRPFEAQMLERLRRALEGHWRPDYAVLRTQADAHRQALVSLGASYPRELPTMEKAIARAAG
jgi:hypothetical protein